MDRKRVLVGTTPAAQSDEPVSAVLTAERAEEVRARVRLMIEITARAGAYRKGLLAAARHLSPEEAAIISDLERHGLQVPQLRDVHGGGDGTTGPAGSAAALSFRPVMLAVPGA